MAGSKVWGGRKGIGGQEECLPGFGDSSGMVLSERRKKKSGFRALWIGNCGSVSLSTLAWTIPCNRLQRPRVFPFQYLLELLGGGLVRVSLCSLFAFSAVEQIRGLGCISGKRSIAKLG